MKTYHIAPTGSNSGPGSEAEPFQTIGKAAQIAMPGDTVVVHEGEYREWVKPQNGGLNDNHRITYQAAQGEHVVIKGFGTRYQLGARGRRGVEGYGTQHAVRRV